MVDPGRIVFESDEFIVYDIHDLLARHKNWPFGAHDVEKPWNNKPAVSGKFYEIRDRTIVWFYFHQTGGSVSAHGFDAPVRTARFATRDPAWVQKKVRGVWRWTWTGRGRGWPGIGYPYYLPYAPEKYKGKIVIYMCQPPDMVCWHSRHNANSSALVLQGYFVSRHMRTFKCKPGQTGNPSDDQWTGLEAFTMKYVLEKLGVRREHLRGHCDSPKPKLTCPGDDVERWKNRVVAGKDSGFPSPDHHPPHAWILDLPDWSWRQAALVAAGHDLGSYGPKKNGVDGDPGDRTRAAVEAVEALLGLPVDGYWDDTFDAVFGSYLQGMGITKEDLEALI